MSAQHGREDCQREAGFGFQLHSVETVVNVVLAQGRWSIPRVRVSSESECAVQSSPELHGFRRGVRQSGGVNGTPRVGPGVVTQESWAAEQLLLDGRRGRLEVDQVSDELIVVTQRRTGCQ